MHHERKCRVYRCQNKLWVKFPKLSELYQTLFGENFEYAHKALPDTQACASCFFELLNRKIISL